MFGRREKRNVGRCPSVYVYIHVYILFSARLGAQPRSSDRYPVPYTGAGTPNSPGTTRTAVTVSSRSARPRDRPPHRPSDPVIIGRPADLWCHCRISFTQNGNPLHLFFKTFHPTTRTHHRFSNYFHSGTLQMSTHVQIHRKTNWVNLNAPPTRFTKFKKTRLCHTIIFIYRFKQLLNFTHFSIFKFVFYSSPYLKF